jgi:hypothetical protein
MPLLLAWLTVLWCGLTELHLEEARPSTPAVQGPHLALDAARHLPAPVKVVGEDLMLDLQQGAGFVAFAGAHPTALVLVGRGTMRFSPPIRSEQRQLQLVAGSPTLTIDFDTAYVRLHPDAFDAHVESAGFRTDALPGDLLRRAQGIFEDEVGRSFSQETLQQAGPSLHVAALPALDDLLVEVHTRRHGRLTYLRLTSEPEDVALLDHDRERALVVYPSRAHRAGLGFSFGDEYGLPYEVSHYDIESSLDPARFAIFGRTRLRMRALDTFETVRLRLDHGLVVNDVRSREQGAHEFLQESASNTLLVRLVPPLAEGNEITLEVTYAGTVKPQDLLPGGGSEGAGLSGPDEPLAPGVPRASGGAAPPDGASLLYSNRVYWFPQSPVRNHTTVVLRVEVPADFVAVASAQPEEPASVTGPSGKRTFRFRTDRPVRYVALLVGKLMPVDGGSPPAGPVLRGVSSARQVQRARAEVREAAEMVRYFSSLVGESPFPPLTLALVEAPGPSAHSPAYLSIIGKPPGWDPARVGDDPGYYAAEPEFFVAHEVAHQWWGQAVGWRNYREQWLSEAFAQYFAALYIQHARGEKAFRDVLAWMNRWAAGAVERGPISLGIRAGQVAGRREQFVAIVYDRGACVLHMLRGLLGDEVFFRALRLYFDRWKFRRAGTDDFRRTLEEASGLELGRFFDQWVRDDGEPELHWTGTVSTREGRERLRLRLEQVGEAFELPLEVRIDYTDRPSTTVCLHVSAPREERDLDLSGTFRAVRLNDDHGALCRLHEDR